MCYRTYDTLQKKRDSLKKAFEKANAKDYELQTSMEQVNLARKKFKQQIVNEQKKLSELENLPEKSARVIIFTILILSIHLVLYTLFHKYVHLRK